jgi:dihydropteroate synthase
LVEEEIGRVVPVIRTLAADGARVSVDTMRAEVAEQALAAGAVIVNDVSGGLADPRILDVVAASEATYVCMHWRGHSDRMQGLAAYDGPGGVVAAVRAELADRVGAARAVGIPDERIVVDPGLGFAKTARHNWTLLAGLPRLQDLGFPLLVGASRKSFLGSLLQGPDGSPRPVDEREDATTALTVLLAQQGVWGIRVHEVRAARDALKTLARYEEG